ncbi:hypothetical protein HWV62_7352 [Athelia sp. TMB]|nr:hypothetical protein HWV62_7352 [Athelia sp. TMB]
MDATRSMSEPLLAMAKRQLGLPPYIADSAVPKAYHDELRHHLITHPDDTNFTLQLQPHFGLGLITCLEAGCSQIPINLVARVKMRDGGKQDGLGSLSTYRMHANQPSHKKAKLARLKGGAFATNSNTTPIAHTPSMPSLAGRKRPSLLSTLDASFGSPSTSPAVQPKIEPSPDSVTWMKPEPVESSIPKKRSFTAGTMAATGSTSVNRTLVKNEGFSLYDKPSPPKKTKVEAPKTPLKFLDVNMVPTNPPPALTLAQVTSKLEAVNREYNTLDAQSRLLAGRRSKADKRQYITLKGKLDKLQKERQHYAALVQSLTPPQSRLGSLNPLARLPPNPMMQDPKPIPPLMASGSNQLPSPYEARLGALNSLARLVPNPMTQGHKTVHLPIASGSNIRLPDVYIPDVLKYRDVKMGIDTTDDEGFSSDFDEGFGPGRRVGARENMMELDGGYGENFDADGNFFGRGRDTFMGPKANADDINKFLVAAGNSEQFDGNASIEQALAQLGLANQYDLLPGMAVALMPHQIIGVAWMKNKELGTHMMQGGILADEMGLGKTVQMIATMTINQATGSDVKTNLILAPMALLDQWKLEIETKTNDAFKCHIYHGSGKAKKKSELLKYDVVLTTYSTLALEWPDYEAEEKAKKKKAKKTDFIETDSEDEKNPKKKQKGLLFQVKFLRIICDEAQNIRNKRTRTARCVTDLDAKFRWCLTGTPITNAITDAYSLLRFLKIRPWYDWQEFNMHIGRYEKRSPDIATKKLQAIFATVLLRRKKDSQLDGKRLIELPSKTVSLEKLEFTDEERAIYQMVETRSQNTFNRFLRAGTVLKNYHQGSLYDLTAPSSLLTISIKVLVLLLRLRQICSHPALIQEDGVALTGPDDMDETLSPEAHGELSRATALVGPEFVARMKYKLKELTLRRMEAEKLSVDATIEDEDEKLFSRHAFEPTEADLNPEAVKPEVEDIDIKPDLLDVFEDALPAKADRKGKGKAKRARRVADSEDDSEGEADSDLDDFIVQSDEDEDDKNSRLVAKKRLGKNRAIVESDSESDEEEREVIHGRSMRSDAYNDVDVKMLPRFLPSTKMKRMMELLMTWAKEHPEEKTLIISQWTQCLQLVSDYLTENKFLHVKYQGDMSRPKRDAAVRVFMAKDKAQIMLMSLKCGGVGLNLTRANRVISLDLGWSEAVEASVRLALAEKLLLIIASAGSQAFDRVHRLGQQRNVFVQRLVIENTVEDRVLALQDRKKGIADGSLGEGTGKKIGRLSVRELANLFGLDGYGNRLITANAIPLSLKIGLLTAALQGHTMSIRADCVRIVGFLKKKEGITREEFSNHWLNKHAPLFTSLEITKTNLSKYEQVTSPIRILTAIVSNAKGKFECHPSSDPAAAALEQVVPLAKWDGMAIFEGESFEKIMEVFSSPEYFAKVAPDEDTFIDREATQFLALDLATLIGM